MASSKRPTLRDDLLYAGLVLVARLARALPLRTGQAAGRALGRLAWHVVRRERNKALRHLAAALPHRTESERREIARAMFRHLGESVFEIAWIPRLNPDVLARTTTIEGLDNLRRAVDSGRGVVLFTGHCGNWEWLCAVIALSGFRLNAIARAIDDPRLNQFITSIRASQGATTIGRGSAVSAREMLRTLHHGEILGVLIDQSIRAETVDVSFFGKPAPTPVGAARIAIRAGASVISAFDERRGGHHYVRFDPPVMTSGDDDPEGITTAMHKAIEAQIEKRPDQWVWMHDRWRRR